MELKKCSLIFLPAILIAWLLSTVFIDLMAVPLVFQTVSSRDEASLLGVGIFKMFNHLEIVFILSSLFFMKLSSIFSLNDFLLKISYLLFFPFFYSFYLTNKIVSLNASKMNEIDDAKLQIIQKDLDFFHQLYVRLDSVKIFILIFSIILIINQIRKYITINSELK
ncbi:MAG: hypothetical protein VX341_07755 [Bdellovibrionota bacterium]|nr:hypothetical protein [Bdellovibrionota bacterium]